MFPPGDTIIVTHRSPSYQHNDDGFAGSTTECPKSFSFTNLYCLPQADFGKKKKKGKVALGGIIAAIDLRQPLDTQIGKLGGTGWFRYI